MGKLETAEKEGTPEASERGKLSWGVHKERMGDREHKILRRGENGGQGAQIEERLSWGGRHRVSYTKQYFKQISW